MSLHREIEGDSFPEKSDNLYRLQKIDLVISPGLLADEPVKARVAGIFVEGLNGLSIWCNRYLEQEKAYQQIGQQDGHPGVEVIKGSVTRHMTDIKEGLSFLTRVLHAEDSLIPLDTRRMEATEALRKLEPAQRDTEEYLLEDLQVFLLDRIEESVAGSIQGLGVDDAEETRTSTASINIDSPIALEAFVGRIGQVSHELGRELTAGFVAQQYYSSSLRHKPGFSWDGICAEVTECSVALGKFLDNTANYLKNSVPQEEISPWMFLRTVKDFPFSKMFEDQGIDVVIDDLEGIAAGGRIIYSYVWLKMLLNNIAGNTIDTYAARDRDRMGNPRSLRIRLQMQEEQGSRCLTMFSEDYGKGYEELIVKDGFANGRSFWADGITGNGIGMALHQAVLRDCYGAEIKADNVLDWQNRPMGVLAVSFPLVSAGFLNSALS